MAEEAKLGLIPECQLLMTILYNYHKCMVYWKAAYLLEKREGTSNSSFWRLFVGAILTDHTFANFYTGFDLSPSLSQIHPLLMPTHCFFYSFYFFTYPIQFVILRLS